MRLPVKSLIRCRCVCKLWNSLFYDTYFTRSHFNRSISQNPSHEDDDYLILMNTYEGRSPCVLSMLSRTNSSEARIDKVPYPLSSQVDAIYLVGSRNGLVCIVYLNDLDYYFILWNPATHQSRTLLLPRQCPLIYRQPIAYLFGFGWDSMTEEFKLIANPSFLSFQSIVYSSKTDSWSNCVNVLSLFPMYITIRCYCPSVIVKGIPYWNLPQDSSVVIKFDVRTNEFSHFKVRPYYVQGYFSLLNMNDCLGLVEYGRYSSDVYRFREEGNFWSKTHTINPCKMNKRKSTYYKYGGEIVFNGKNAMYDPKSNEIKSLAYGKKSGYSVHGFSYTPSLLALEGMKTI